MIFQRDCPVIISIHRLYYVKMVGLIGYIYWKKRYREYEISIKNKKVVMEAKMILYRLPARICKLIAMFMVWVIVSQPVFVVAAEDQAKIENEKITTYQGEKTAVVKAEEEETSVNSRQFTDKEKELQFGNRLLDYYIKDRQKKGPEWLKNSEFSIHFSEHNSPVYSLETLQPLGGLTKNGQQWFWQGRYARESVSDSTGNIGFGWRKLAQDKSSLFGMNLFYDYGFQYNLQRLGVGTEYFNKLAEYRANWYYPLSNDRLTGISYQTNGMLYSYIRAVEGVDFEAGTSFTHVPWLKIFAGGYFWDNKYHDDEIGYRLRSTMQLTPQMNMEVGYMHSNVSHSLYGNVKYQLAFGAGKESQKETQGKVANVNISEKLLQKVERENNIKTETYTKLAWYTGSIKTTVTSSMTNTPIYGATVQAYQNGVAVGIAATTDAGGNAILSGLNVGNYTVHVSYAGGMYTNDSSSVTVAKDAVVNAAIGLAVSGGSTHITVTNHSGMALSGATVTAIYKSSSTTVASLGTKFLNRILGVQTAYAAAATFSISTTTGADGVATFTNLPPGTYLFKVTCNGELMTSEEIAVTSGGTSTDTIIMPISGGNIRVVVKDTSGLAVSDASVTAVSSSIAVGAGKTDATGVAILSGISAGSYTIATSHANYATNSSVSVEVREGYTSKSTLTLTRNTGSAAISVTFSDGATSAVPSFYVDSSSTAASAVAAGSYTTNGDGSITRVYTINGLTTNVAHSIAVTLANYTASGSLRLTPTSTTIAIPSSITLTRNAESPGSAVVVGSAAISVTFSDGATSTVPSFTVDGAAASAVAAGSYTTNGDGSITRVYTISGLTANVAHSITAAADHYTSSTGAINVTPTTTGVTPGSIVLTKEIVYVTVAAGAHGTTTYGATTIAAGTTASIPVNYGSSLTLHFAPTTHYKVSTVTVGGSNEGAISSYTLSNITSSVAVSSAYAEITYTLTITATGGQLKLNMADNSAYNESVIPQYNTYTVTLYSTHQYTLYLLYNQRGAGYDNAVYLLNGQYPTGDITCSY